MSDLTRAQKARLGIFLLFAAGLLAVVVVVKVGESLFDHRDVYHVRMPGSVGSLDPGSAVTFNGIVVGRIERVAVDSRDVAVVAIDLSLAAGTPIPEDTEASVAMRGITGLKYIELTGGTNAARRRLPGEELPAGRSTLDNLQDRAIAIGAKLERLLDDAHVMLRGPSMGHVDATLASIQRTVEALENTLVGNLPRVAGLIRHGEELAVELKATLIEARSAAASVRKAGDSIDVTMRSVDTTFQGLGTSLTRIATQVEPLVRQVTSALGRAGVDLRSALDEMVQGFASVSSLADMLRADPSSIILGKSGRERELP